MADYIDRDALNWWDDLYMKGINKNGVWVRYRDVEHFIKDAPAVDAVEVGHGKWIDTDNYFYRWKCSACGRHTKDVLPNYCGWCGARMDGRREEEHNAPN